MTLCAKTPKSRAEELRKKLLDEDFLDTSKEIISEGGFVYFPLKEGAKHTGKTVEKEVPGKTQRPRSISEILRSKLSPEELEHLKTSYDLYGEVVVVEVPQELEPKEKLIGESFLQFYPKLRAVFKKSSPVEGEYRVRELKRIAGTGTPETTYKEHGCTYSLDLSKVFFTPRLATERLIIADQVRPDEVVLDMFAGAGPFSILIAKQQPLVKHIYAIDLNPDATAYLEKNAEFNKVSGKITALTGDAAELASKVPEKADRIIMNLPKTEKNHLPAALKALKKKGVIHYYTFAGSEGEVRQRLERLLKDVKFRLLAIRNVKPYAPGEWCFAADILVDHA